MAADPATDTATSALAPAGPPAPVLAVLGTDGRATPAELGRGLVRGDDLGLLRGESVFETLRIRSRRAFRLDAHLTRLRHSAARIALEPPDPSALAGLAACALDSFGDGDGSLRIVVTKGPESGTAVGYGQAFALASPIGAATERARREGVAAMTLTLGVPADLRRDAPWLLGGVKSTSYAVAMASLRHAAESGGTDAVYVSCDGEVLEAPTANVVALVAGVLVSPPEDEVGILPGTTVGFFDTRAETPIVRRRLTVEELRAAEEVLLLSSVRGVVAVHTLDGAPIGTGEVGPRARSMAAAYERAVASPED